MRVLVWRRATSAQKCLHQVQRSFRTYEAKPLVDESFDSGRVAQEVLRNRSEPQRGLEEAVSKPPSISVTFEVTGCSDLFRALTRLYHPNAAFPARSGVKGTSPSLFETHADVNQQSRDSVDQSAPVTATPETSSREILPDFNLPIHAKEPGWTSCEQLKEGHQPLSTKDNSTIPHVEYGLKQSQPALQNVRASPEAVQLEEQRASVPQAGLKGSEDANHLKAQSTVWESALTAESHHMSEPSCYSQAFTCQHQSTLAELRHQHEIQLSEAKDQLSRRMTQHQRDLSELSDNMTQTLSTLNAKHQVALSELRAQLQTAHTDKLSIATELDSLLSEHESLMTKEAHTRADFTQLQQQQQQLVGRDKQQQVQVQLASEASQYNLACLQAAIGHKVDLEHQLITVTEAQSQAAQHTAALSHELCVLEKEFTIAVGKLKDLCTQLQTAEEALEREVNAHQLLRAAHWDEINAHVQTRRAVECSEAQLQRIERAHKRELRVHEQTRCAAQRTEAQLMDLGDFYRQQAQAQADAKADTLYLLHDEAQHDLFTDFQSMERQLVALQAKCQLQRQQIKDSAEDQKGLTAALDKVTAEKTESWRLNKEGIVSKQKKISDLQEQLVSAQKLTVAAQEQMTSAQDKAASAQEQLSVLDERHRRTSDSHQAEKAALTEDLHRLEDEILRLEGMVQVTEQARLQQQQQQQHEQQMLESHASNADLPHQLTQAHSRIDQLVSCSCADQAVHTESIGSLMFKIGDTEEKLRLAQQQLQHQSDQSSKAEEELERKLSASDSQLSELKAEQDSLRAHLGRLHELAIKNQITPEAIFSMFADPVAPAVANGGHIADAPATTAANSLLPSATTANASAGSLPAPASTPQATASSLPATASTLPATASTPPVPAIPLTGKSITAPAATAVSKLVATASMPVPNAGQSQALTTLDSAGLGSDVASVHESVLRLPVAEPSILLESGSDFQTDIVRRSEELQEEAAAEGVFFVQGEEEDDSKRRAAHLQRGMFMHPNLTLAAALDIGAAAYAESVQDFSFSTQQVIDLILEHDKCFQGMLEEASTDFEIDIWELRFAVVDAYRYCKEYEDIMISKGKVKQRWATEAPRNAVIWASGAAGGMAGLEDTRSIHMVIPGAWKSKESVALQLLYTYWGIPLRNEMYSW